MTAPGATIIGAIVTTDPTGPGAPIDHGAPTGPIVRTDRIGPTDQAGLIVRTDPTGRTDRIVQTDQIVRTGLIDSTGPIGRIGLIAADQQSIARPARTYNPAARTALAARQRRRRPTVSSRAVRVVWIPDRAGICRLYNSGRNLLSNSYAASDYVIPGRRLTGGRTNSWLQKNMRSHSVWLTSRVSRGVPTEYFVLANLKEQGAIIGQLAGHPIADTVVDARGSRYRYVGVATRDANGRFDVEALRAGEWIVQPGLVYAADGKVSPSKPPRRG